jgi:hypothetical protein
MIASSAQNNVYRIRINRKNGHNGIVAILENMISIAVRRCNIQIVNFSNLLKIICATGIACGLNQFISQHFDVPPQMIKLIGK